MNENNEDIKGRILKAEELVAYQDGSIVSRTIVQKKEGTITLFAFDEGESLSEHTAPFDALISILDGEAIIKIANDENHLTVGDMIVLPALVPHAVKAKKRFRMLLAMIRTE
jgi:quercetin dioxygenase-like cupin family protein